MAILGAYSIRASEIPPAGLRYGYGVAAQAPFQASARGSFAAGSVLQGMALSWEAQDFVSPEASGLGALQSGPGLLALLIRPGTPARQLGQLAWRLADLLDCRAELNARLSGPQDPLAWELLQRLQQGLPLECLRDSDPFGGPYQITPALVLEVLARQPDALPRPVLALLHDVLAEHLQQRMAQIHFFSALKLMDPTRHPKRDRRTLEQVSRCCNHALDESHLEALCQRYLARAPRTPLPPLSPAAAARYLQGGLLRWIAWRTAALADIAPIGCREDLQGRRPVVAAEALAGHLGALGRLEAEVDSMHAVLELIRCQPEDAGVSHLRQQARAAIEQHVRASLQALAAQGGARYMASMSAQACAGYPHLARGLLEEMNAGGGPWARLRKRFGLGDPARRSGSGD